MGTRIVGVAVRIAALYGHGLALYVVGKLSAEPLDVRLLPQNGPRTEPPTVWHCSSTFTATLGKSEDGNIVIQGPLGTSMRDLKRTQRALGTPPVTATTPNPGVPVKVTFELQDPKKALAMMIEVCNSSLAKAAKPISAPERPVVELMEHSDTNTVVPVPVIFDKELLLVEVTVVEAKPMTATQSPPVILHLDVDAYVVVFFVPSH